MATNNFKPFATAANANVTAQADWESLPALLSGFTAGKASSAQVNKAIRQASFIAAALAQYTANKSGLDVLDDGDLNGFIAKMSAAFGKDFQALDATLTALAGLTTGANKLPYFTGTDTASQTDLTSVGRDIIGKGTIADILTYLGLGKTDSPEFGGLKAPSITLRDGKISLTSSTDGTTLVFTVSGEPVAEIKAGSFFHKKIISAGEVLQSPKYIFRDGDIIFYSGQNNLVMQVGGNDVATLTSDSFYHVKQVAADESLKAPKVVLRDGDVNLIGGANNLVIQVGGNDIASLTPGNNFFKGKLTAETSLQVGSTCILATDGNLTGSKWGGWLDAFMKDGMSTDGNGLWWDAFSSQLQFRVGDWNIPDAAGGAGTSVTFPKAFKNGCLMVIPIPGNGGASQQIGSQSYSASGAVLQKGASDNNPRSGKYLAIGY
ncbi:TPA: gp53-like domain-containing protein [Citrobacter freundii]|uniref:gp53-like domain-containing protein n=1 Tax=Citrobacter freundii TaxID=546 RepID=UPI0036D71246